VATAAEIQASLPPEAALFCYFTTGVLDWDIPLLRAIPAANPLREHLLTPACTLLFVLTREKLAAYECPLDPNTFTSASPRRGDRSRFLAPNVLRRLHTTLLAPAAEALSANRLYLVPHGPLHHVPFGALVDQEEQPLLRSGGPRLVYAPSATVLLRHRLTSRLALNSPSSCLAVGYDGRPGERALRHTEAEALFVANLTGGEAWVGAEAKKERLAEQSSEQRWLHFACHGEFNDESPLDSWLEIGAGERLTAAEVLRGWQLQADLVTLSACQTGVSRVLRGDEPFGLIRAFLAAGARAVLATQWPVEDLPTFLLMQRFYGELSSQEANLAAALQAAQIWLRQLTTAEAQAFLVALAGAGLPLNQPDPLAAFPADAQPFAHPRHWAAFALIGVGTEDL
jgi:CHAT domain-containing protein